MILRSARQTFWLRLNDERDIEREPPLETLVEGEYE
jgi:hypothetical protein